MKQRRYDKPYSTILHRTNSETMVQVGSAAAPPPDMSTPIYDGVSRPANDESQTMDMDWLPVESKKSYGYCTTLLFAE